MIKPVNYQCVRDAIIEVNNKNNNAMKKIIVVLLNIRGGICRIDLKERADVNNLELDNCVKVLLIHKLIKEGRNGYIKTVKFKQFIGRIKNEFK